MVETNILLETGTNELEILEFKILMHEGHNQSFGINVAKVREVILVPKFDEVPNSHEAVLGVFQLRGKVMPLINLSTYLHGKSDVDDKTAKVIVTEFNQQNFGFLVNDVVSIHRLSWEDVEPPTQTLSNQEHDCIVALIPMKEKTLFMLDFEKIVSDINPESGLKVSEAEKEVQEGIDKPYKVLVADDSETIRSMIHEILSKAGFSLTSVTDGKAALEKVMEYKENVVAGKGQLSDYIDVIVSDIEMPQMDGHSLCKVIKEDTVLQAVPVILFSSLIYEEIRKKGNSVGADAQISKPELRNLVQIVKKLVKNKPKKIEQLQDEPLNTQATP